MKDDLDETIKEMAHSLEGLKGRIEKNLVELSQSRCAITKLQRENGDLRVEDMRLNKEIEDRRNRNFKLSKELVGLRPGIVNLEPLDTNDLIKLLQKELDKQTLTISELKAHEIKLQDVLRGKDEEIEELKPEGKVLVCRLCSDKRVVARVGGVDICPGCNGDDL